VGVEGGAVQLRPRAQLPHGYFLDGLSLVQQGKQGVPEQHLRKPGPLIFFHVHIIPSVFAVFVGFAANILNTGDCKTNTLSV
jgi:hypothetical protein